MSKKYRQKKARLQNWHCDNMWLSKIFRLASSCIKWEGLDENIDTVLLENLINRGASAIIGWDEVLGEYIIGQNASYGRLDRNGYPIERRAVCINGENVYFNEGESVIIYNNSMKVNDVWMWVYCAQFMAELDNAIRINCNTQKTMPIIPTTQSQSLSMENVMDMIEQNMPYLLMDIKSFDLEAFKAAMTFDNRKSFTADQMLYVQNEVWNRILSMIGINNINHFKKERVSTDETNANLNEVFMFRRDRLNARELAAKKMKELFGWDVKVSYYQPEGREVNGLLYNGGALGMPAVHAGQQPAADGGAS